MNGASCPVAGTLAQSTEYTVSQNATSWGLNFRGANVFSLIDGVTLSEALVFGLVESLQLSANQLCRLNIVGSLKPMLVFVGLCVEK